MSEAGREKTGRRTRATAWRGEIRKTRTRGARWRSLRPLEGRGREGMGEERINVTFSNLSNFRIFKHVSRGISFKPHFDVPRTVAVLRSYNSQHEKNTCSE